MVLRGWNNICPMFDVTHFYNATNDGQTLGSGYIGGATNAFLIIPGYNESEEGSSNSIVSQGARL